MGFQSIISGYISVETLSIMEGDNFNRKSNKNKLISALENHINSLPKISEDNVPFLPREIFSISYFKENSLKLPIGYNSILIHFGMSVKQLDENLDNWLIKYETFLKSCPNASESLVNIKLIPYTASLKNQHLNYRWHKKSNLNLNENNWYFEGDLRSWSELFK